MENRKKRALIVGMARSGIAAARLLYETGYEVTVNDMKSEIDGLTEALAGIEYTSALGKAPETLLDGIDLMVLSPVVPIFAPFAKAARARGIEVIGEIELGYRCCDRGTKFVCISGTNGKQQPLRLRANCSGQRARTPLCLATSECPSAHTPWKHARETMLWRKRRRFSLKALNRSGRMRLECSTSARIT